MATRPADLGAEERGALTIQVRAELAHAYARRGDVLNWGRVLFPHKFPHPFCDEMHGDFVRVRADPLTCRKAPRGHSKTTVRGFLIETYQALVEPGRFQHYLNVQTTDVKALALNESIKNELEYNEALHAAYGYQVGRDRWTSGQFVLKNGTIFSAVGAGQSIRGIQYLSKRPDYVLADDLYDEKHINNYEATQEISSWFWGTLYPLRARGQRFSLHAQGTAVNKYAIYEQLEKDPGWDSRTFRAIIDFEKRTTLWPAIWAAEAELWNESERNKGRPGNKTAWDVVERDRFSMGSLIFNRELQNELRDDHDSIIKIAWLRDWEYDPSELKFGIDYPLLAVLLNVDPSVGKIVGKKSKVSDPTAAALMYKGRYADGDVDDYYIQGLWEQRLSMDKRLDLLREIRDGQARERRITETRIEAISGFEDFASQAKRKIDGLNVISISSVKDKITNLENKSGFFEHGRVKINKNIDPTLKRRLFDQLVNNTPDNDDLRDAVLLGLDEESDQWRHVA